MMSHFIFIGAGVALLMLYALTIVYDKSWFPSWIKIDVLWATFFVVLALLLLLVCLPYLTVSPYGTVR